MKRLYICSTIFIGLIVISQLCLHQITVVQQEMDQRLDVLIREAEADNYENAYNLTLELQEYWEESERLLMAYVRHQELDTLTISVSRLPYLAKHRATAEYLSEVNIIKNLMHHIWHSELPIPRNIM